MYTHYMHGLGEDPVAVAEPSLWDNILKIGTTAVSTGFNIYNRVQNLTAQQKAAAAAKTQAEQLAQYSAMYGARPVPGQPGQPIYGQPIGQTVYGQQQSDFFSGWTIPLLVAGAAVVGFVMLKRK